LVYKFIFSLLIVFSLSCSEIDRDNILDPKNPSSKRDRVLVLEAFVNTNNPLPYNNYALNAIETLSNDDDIKDHLIILEYHRDTQEYTDPLKVDSLNTNAENIYTDYINYDLLHRFKGVPDLFLNGATDRVQGASSSTSVTNRVKNLATEQLLDDGMFTIEADFDLDGSTINGTYRIARLGNQSADEMLLRMLITWDSGAMGKRTVSKVMSPLAVGPISSGKYIEDDFTVPNIPSGRAEKLVFVLTDITGLNILHAIERDIL